MPRDVQRMTEPQTFGQGTSRGGIKTMWGFSCDFPDLCLLVCRVSLHVLGTPIPVLGLELRWGSVLTHSPIPIAYNLLPETQVLPTITSYLQPIQSPCPARFCIFPRLCGSAGGPQGGNFRRVLTPGGKRRASNSANPMSGF